MLSTMTAIRIQNLNENSFPSADRIAAFPMESGIAPSRTPCGQIYLQKKGSPIPIEFVASMGRRITKNYKDDVFQIPQRLQPGCGKISFPGKFCEADPETIQRDIKSHR